MKAATNGGFDVVFEVVGSGETVNLCIDASGAVVMMQNLWLLVLPPVF